MGKVLLFVLIAAGVWAASLLLAPARAFEGVPSVARADSVAAGAPRVAVVEAAGRSDEPRASAAPRRSTGATVSGEIVVRDRTSRTRTPASARFELVGEATRTVFARHGQWQVEGGGDGKARVEGVVVDGLAATPVHPLVDLSGPARIEVEVVMRDRLRVLDAATKADLDGVTVVRAGSLADSEMGVPSGGLASRPLVSGASSPLAIPDVPGIHSYWVGAAGYEWRQVDLRGGSDQQQVVELGREATLNVAWRDGRTPIDASLALYRTTGGERRLMSRCAASAEGAQRFTGLPPGDYSVRLHAARSAGQGAVLDRSDVALEAGRSGQVVLDAFPDPTRFGGLELTAFVECAVSRPVFVTVQSTTLEEPVHLSFRYQVGVTSARCQVFAIEHLPPGAYHVALATLGIEDFVEVRAAEIAQASLHLREVGRLGIEAVHSETGHRVHAVRASVRDLNGSWVPALLPLERVVGATELRVDAPGFETETVAVELEPGTRTLDLEMTPRVCHLAKLELACAGESFVAPSSFWEGIRIETEGSTRLLGQRSGTDGAVVRTSFSDSGTTLLLSDAGAFSVSFPTLDGFEEIPTVRVAEGEGERATRVVLQRRGR